MIMCALYSWTIPLFNCQYYEYWCRTKAGRMTILSCKTDRTQLTGGPGSPWLSAISP